MNNAGRRIKKIALERLKDLIKELDHLMTLKYDNPEFKHWGTRVKNLLNTAFDITRTTRNSHIPNGGQISRLWVM